jgi:hypothetical protein
MSRIWLDQNKNGQVYRCKDYVEGKVGAKKYIRIKGALFGN